MEMHTGERYLMSLKEKSNHLRPPLKCGLAIVFGCLQV